MQVVYLSTIVVRDTLFSLFVAVTGRNIRFGFFRGDTLIYDGKSREKKGISLC